MYNPMFNNQVPFFKKKKKREEDEVSFFNIYITLFRTLGHFSLNTVALPYAFIKLPPCLRYFFPLRPTIL